MSEFKNNGNPLVAIMAEFTWMLFDRFCNLFERDTTAEDFPDVFPTE